MKLYSLYLAIDTDKNGHYINPIESMKTIQNLILNSELPASIFPCTGIYEGKIEQSVKIEIASELSYVTLFPRICSLVTQLKAYLNQKCVMVSRQDLSITFFQ